MGDGSGPNDGPQMRGCVKLLVERFPHVRAISLELLHRHEAFRDLCEEYEVCTEACERLERSRSDEALRKEYSALRLRLESELLRYIEEHTTPPTGP
jgi:hypothetical protein